MSDELGETEQQLLAALTLGITAVQALAKISPEAREGIAAALPVMVKSYRDSGWDIAAGILEQTAALIDQPLSLQELLDASVALAQREVRQRKSEE